MSGNADAAHTAAHCAVCAALEAGTMPPHLDVPSTPCPHCGTAGNGERLLVDFAKLLQSTKPKAEPMELERFMKTIEAGWGPYTVAVVDMSGVEHLSSMWMGRFVLLNQKSKAANKRVRLVVPPGNRYVRQAFEVTKLDKLMPVFPDLAAAEQG